MLSLQEIKKMYQSGGNQVAALKGLTLDFRQKEFVAILGPSGCGKTTLLNIIGGLDRYSSGNLIIDGVSTKKFKDRDWDLYRNHQIGFVFQSYHLIPHLNVLQNVEIAPQLSGVKAKERKKRSIQALEQVGLKEHIYKRPNQLSGGQMQRVAIARALVNNPEIILADEPTGALDSETSVEIMHLLKDIAQDKLIIMVTHNEALAKAYSTRIVRLLDGRVVEDTNPAKLETMRKKQYKKRKIQMSYWSALKLSFNNLISKKGRTFLTALAGSIGIIGVALVLSISNGFSTYLSDAQAKTLSGMPITIAETVRKLSGPPRVFSSDEKEQTDKNDAIHVIDETDKKTHKNNMTQAYVDYLNKLDAASYSFMYFAYGADLQVLAQKADGSYQQSNSASIGMKVIPQDPVYLHEQYTLLSGRQITNQNEAVLILNSDNQLDKKVAEFLDLGTDITQIDQVMGKDMRLIGNNQFYLIEGERYRQINETEYPNAYEQSGTNNLKIVGVVKKKTADLIPKPVSDSIGIHPDMEQTMLQENETSNIVNKQRELGEGTNVLTGLPFFPLINPETKQEITASDQYEQQLQQLGGTSLPISINIYPTSFETKETITSYLNKWNDKQAEENKIIYTDLSEQIETTMNSIISTATGVLVGVAAISLIVSSFMIAIITYVSVIERTKEIGILRSLGARKKDITRIFNAETILIGLTSGILGVIITLGINVILNILFMEVLQIDTTLATLKFSNGVTLISISVILTFLSGFIPSKMAARKDPVAALRTE